MRKPSHINQLVYCKKCPLTYCLACQPSGCKCSCKEYIMDHGDIKGEGTIISGSSNISFATLGDRESLNTEPGQVLTMSSGGTALVDGPYHQVNGTGALTYGTLRSAIGSISGSAGAISTRNSSEGYNLEDYSIPPDRRYRNMIGSLGDGVDVTNAPFEEPTRQELIR